MRFRIAAALIGLLITGCESSSEFQPTPVLIPGWHGGAAPAPAQPARPLVPGVHTINEDLSNVPGVRETHFVMNSSYCQSMARRFTQQGLRLTFTRFIPSPQPGARKAGHCIFEGEDADPNRFADTRYNNPDDYR